ncbi:hypothetical protein [Leptolyngbya sp. NK1-12]|uniref:hypothetical protein n=1 Tax=Leptolyngbya sp. NK1-12 TaxID=2547451 RepID=UPI003B636196
MILYGFVAGLKETVWALWRLVINLQSFSCRVCQLRLSRKSPRQSKANQATGLL